MKFSLVRKYEPQTGHYNYSVEVRSKGQKTNFLLAQMNYNDTKTAKKFFKDFIEGYTSKEAVLEVVEVDDE